MPRVVRYDVQQAKDPGVEGEEQREQRAYAWQEAEVLLLAHSLRLSVPSDELGAGVAQARICGRAEAVVLHAAYLDYSRNAAWGKT